MIEDPRDREVLAYYPYVVVRIQCDRCTRTGAFRLARLAAKFGPQAPTDHVLRRLTADCHFRHARHPIHGHCEARFVDLGDQRAVEDLPPRTLKLMDVARAAAHLAARANEAGLHLAATDLQVGAMRVEASLRNFDPEKVTREEAWAVLATQPPPRRTPPERR